MPRLEVADQNSPNWYAARRGCFTASRAEDALGRTAVRLKADGTPYAGSGAFRDARDRYAIELVAERMVDSLQDHLVTAAMQWGIDNEAGAAELYCERTGRLTEKTGFWLHDQVEFLGASPDRLVGADGLIEVKCPATHNFVRWVKEGVVPAEHRLQMMHQLVVLERDWCDFVAFDPRVIRGPRIFIRRYCPPAAERAAYLEDAKAFLAMVDKLFEVVTTASEV